MAKLKSLTKAVIKNWTSGAKGSVTLVTPDSDKPVSSSKVDFNFLDFTNEEAQSFLIPLLEKLYLTPQTSAKINALPKADKSKLLVLALVKMAKHLAPKDNSEFLFRALIHLAKNPAFENLLHSLVQMQFTELKTAAMNLPELGVFMTPNATNRYTHMLPLTPKTALTFYLGKEPVFNSEEEIADLSYSTTKRSLVLAPQNKSQSLASVRAKQKQTMQKIGNLVVAIEDPAVVMEILKSIVMSLPQVKGSALLARPLEMAFKFWNKK
jgi:hypothetical protein